MDRVFIIVEQNCEIYLRTVHTSANPNETLHTLYDVLYDQVYQAILYDIYCLLSTVPSISSICIYIYLSLSEYADVVLEEEKGYKSLLNGSIRTMDVDLY